jgi:hypothetical protein
MNTSPTILGLSASIMAAPIITTALLRPVVKRQSHGYETQGLEVCVSDILSWTKS